MHKLCVLALLLVALSAASAQRTRFSRLYPTLVRSRPFTINAQNTLQYPVRSIQTGNFINTLSQPVPTGFAGHRIIPDGDYISAHGTVNVDGSDYNFDPHYENTYYY